MKPPLEQGLRGGADEGEARKRDVIERFRVRQRAYLRNCQRVLLDVLLVRGEGTTDDVRERFPLPAGINPKTVGAIPGELADAGIIYDSGRVEKSRRPEAHARKITVWQLADRRAAQLWLDEHPELPAPGNDDGEDTVGPSNREPSPPSSPTRLGVSDSAFPLLNPACSPNFHTQRSGNVEKKDRSMSTPNSGRKRLTDILMNSERDRLESLWKTTAAATDLSPIPAGEYECVIDRGELSESRKNTLGYKITMSVRSGEYAGRKLWHDIWLSEAALPMAKRDLSKLGITSLDQLERPLPAGIIVQAKVALRRNDDGNDFNRITRFEVIAVEPPEEDPFAPDDDEEPGTEDDLDLADSEAPY